MAQELQLKISHHDAESSHKRAEQVSVLILLHGDSSLLLPLAENVRKDLERTSHLRVKIMYAEEPSCTEDLARQFREGYPFVLYLSMQESDAEASGRLYNTLDVAMLQGKKWAKRDSLALWAHYIADGVWKEVIGTESSFLSSIVYVTKDYKRAGSVRSSLVVTEWDGSALRTIFSKNGHILAPAWLPSEVAKDLAIVFSEFTLVNVRLMKVLAVGSSPAEIVLNRGGTTVGVSALSANDIIYCHSGALWHYTYDPDSHQGKHSSVVREKEPCACPVALRNGDIVYCCQGAVKRWSAHDASKVVIAKKGFCTAPTVHEGRNILIFSRRVQGAFQLICKDLETNVESQITHGPGNKIDASISPCGFWAVYTCERGKKSTICIIDLIHNKSFEVSDVSHYAMCPAWSSH